MSAKNVDHLIDWVAFYTPYLSKPPKPAGNRKYNAPCPFHKEDNPSWWFSTDTGCFRCEACGERGNGTTFLAKMEGITTQEAWARLGALAGVAAEPAPPAEHKKVGRKPRIPLTVAQYAEAKALPADGLARLGLYDATDKFGTACVGIPYYDEAGAVTATKLRYHPDGQRFGYLPGGKPSLYGLWMKLNHDAKAVILVEGESDAQTLWLAGIAGYGVPGAGNFQSAWVPVLRDRTVYLHLEPGASGDLFLRNTIEALRRGGFAGKLRSFRCSDANDDAKDPSDLWMRDPGAFPAAMASLLTKAATVDLATALEVRQAMPTSPAVPAAPPRKVKPLDDYMAADLYAAMIEKPPVIVDGMIPAGLTVLAGAPKRGKSWLALQLAIAVAGGTPFLGHNTERGDVLYLDLESRQYRVQQRLRTVLPGKAPDRLRIAHEAERLDSGLLDQLDEWCGRVERPSLVIIDTLGRVKAGSRRGENAYESDTRIYGELQAFAQRRKLAVLAVHHLRKSLPDTDRLERISGSMGLVGVCDAVIGLGGKRTEPENVQLTVDSRDFDPLDLVLEFERGSWSMRSANSEEYQRIKTYNEDPVIRGVIRLADRAKRWEGTPAQLLQDLADLVSMEVTVTPSSMVRRSLLPFKDLLHDRDGVLVNVRRESGGVRRRVVTVRKLEVRDAF